MNGPRIALLAASLTLVACGSGDGNASPADGGASPSGSAPVDDATARVREAAVADLAHRLGVEPAAIEVRSAEPTTWPDGSLGCPEPGRLYTQALVDGYRVLLGHAGRLYAYHAGADAMPFLCASPEEDGGYDFVPPPGFDE